MLLFRYLIQLFVISCYYYRCYGELVRNEQNINNNDITQTIVQLYTLQSDDNLLNDKCKDHAQRYFQDFQMGKSWAIQMMDASSKLQSGILLGNLIDFGSFDECIKIQNHEHLDNPIHGKHCFVSLTPSNKTIRQIQPALALPVNRIANISSRPGDFGITWSICVPHSCMAHDIQTHLQNYIPHVINMEDLTVTVTDQKCVQRKDVYMKLRKSDWVAITFFTTIVILIVLSSLYDALSQYVDAENPNKLLKAFSILENTHNFLSTEGGNASMRVLNGIRFLSTTWVIVFHRFFVMMFLPNINSVDIQDWFRQAHSMIIQGATVSVDTFFTISGMLVLMSFFKIMDRDNKINLFSFYIHRYLRLTPMVAVVVFFYATLLQYCGSGSNWSSAQLGLMTPCRKYWWSTMLYIQNYVNPEYYCVTQTWYLSVDMQLFWLSPLFLYPLYKRPALGFLILVVMIFLPMAISFYLAWINYYNGSLIFQKDLLQTNYFARHYTASHARASPWFIGLGLGYSIYKTRKQQVRIKPVLVIFMWLFTFSMLLLVVFGIYPFQQFETPLNRLKASSYLAFSRTAWSLAIAWIIFASIHGYGGIINTFLSWSGFTVLGKLGYTMFLVHLGLQFSTLAALKTPQYFSMFNEVYNGFADVSIAGLASYFLVVGIEMPVMIIEDYIFKQPNKVKGDLQSKKG